LVESAPGASAKVSAFIHDGAVACIAANLPDMFPRRLFLLLPFVAAACPLVAAAERDPYAQARAEFKRAYDAVDAVAPTDAADSERLRSYPLYPYLQAARIRRALGSTTEPSAPVDQRAETFLTYHDGTPIGRSLRSVWLSSLGERSQWERFLTHYRQAEADDSLECLSFTARIELDRTEGLATEVAAQWLTPRSLQDCERAFEWLRAQNALTPELIEQRVRLALEANSPAFARQIALTLPPERAAPLLQWAALLEKPQREIDALIATPARAVAPEALLAGWSRLARTDRDAAIVRYDALVRARGLTRKTASPYALAIALPLAWDRKPEALEYFARVAPKELDDYALEWLARAALWAEDWEKVADTIAAMSSEQRGLARWRYWAARAAERRDDQQLARQLYESVVLDDNFYALMASARLDQPVKPHPEKLVRDPARIRQIAELPELERARELVKADLRSLAGPEWRQGFARLPQDARTQAIHLAVDWSWYDQAIATASELRVFNDYQLLYPAPYDREVRTAARLSGLDPELIYSVMRQESLYRPDAMSSAGARGLLQMLPETARRTARAFSRPRPSPDDLFKPAINVPLGAAHLRELIDRFRGQTVVALAGYNAGPRAASRWLPPQSVEPDVWIENIPYNETRTYVQRILWHNVVFGWLRTGEPQKADAWLARVAPLGDAAVLGSTLEE
jgi:soluble lytic murein transglycosylase